MSEKLDERLQAALLEAYHEAQDQSLISSKLSEAQRLIEDQVKPLEEMLAQAQADVGALQTFYDEVGGIADCKLFDSRDDAYELAEIVRTARATLPEHLRGER